MFTTLNDGRKVNMVWVLSFYQDGNKVIYDMAKGTTNRIEELFESEEEASDRIDELEDEYLSKN